MAHIALELLQQKAGIMLTGVPYKGGPPMTADLLGGHIPLASDLLSNFVQLAADKKVRLLAVANAAHEQPARRPHRAGTRSGALRSNGVVHGHGAGRDACRLVQTVNAITNRYLQSAAGKDLVARQSAEVGGGTPEDAAAS